MTSLTFQVALCCNSVKSFKRVLLPQETPKSAASSSVLMGVCGRSCGQKWFMLRLRWRNPNVVNQVGEPVHGISEMFVLV